MPRKKARHAAPDTASQGDSTSVANDGVGGSAAPVATVNASIAYEIKSRDATKKTQVMLSVPCADDECPLALESMQEAKLHFFDAPFFADKPEYKKLTLPCGHSFTATLLAYSFCKNGMTCPCCRAGHEVKADVASLPSHLHLEFNKRVEVPEDDDGVQVIGITLPFRISSVGNLSLVVDLFETANARSVFSTHNSLVPIQEEGSDIPAFRTVGNMAGLGAISHMIFMGMGMMRVSVQIDMLGDSIMIDHSDMVDLTEEGVAQQQRIRVPGVRSTTSLDRSLTMHGSNNARQDAQRNAFDIGLRRVLRANNVTHALLDHVVWRPGGFV